MFITNMNTPLRLQVAGPGDPELITVKAIKAIQQADVIPLRCSGK